MPYLSASDVMFTKRRYIKRTYRYQSSHYLRQMRHSYQLHNCQYIFSLSSLVARSFLLIFGSKRSPPTGSRHRRGLEPVVGEPSCALMVECASGSVVECRICNRKVASSNLSLGYFAPGSTQLSIPPGSANEYQLRLGRQRRVWLIPIADERVGVRVKL